MNDWDSYHVLNADLAVAMESNMFLALPKGRWKLLSYFNMTSIEDREVLRRKRRRAS